MGFHVQIKSEVKGQDGPRRRIENALIELGGIDSEVYKVLEFIFRQCMISDRNRSKGWAGYNYEFHQAIDAPTGKQPKEMFEAYSKQLNSLYIGRHNIEFGFEHLDLTKTVLIAEVNRSYKEILEKLIGLQRPGRHGFAIVNQMGKNEILNSYKRKFRDTLEYSNRSGNKFIKSSGNEFSIIWENLPYFSDYISFQFAVYADYLGYRHGAKQKGVGIFEWIATKIKADHASASEPFTEAFFDKHFSRKKIKDRLNNNSSKPEIEKRQTPQRLNLMTEGFIEYLQTISPPHAITG